MATQTRFDLNTAIETWRNELAAQPQLTPDDRRELERHLNDCVAELRGRGLGDEESFWLARRRVGQPQQLADEFKKVNPGSVWPERAFWMAVALVGSYAFKIWSDLLAFRVPEWFFVALFGPMVVLLVAGIIIRRAPASQNGHSMLIPALGLLGVLIATFFAAGIGSRHLPGNDMVSVGLYVGLVTSWVGNAAFPVAVLLFVLVTQKQSGRNRESRSPGTSALPGLRAKSL